MHALIIGLGLIGGSLAKAFKYNDIAKHITVFDPNQSSCDLALDQKVADAICCDLNNISQYQIIVIACPLRAFVNVAPIVFEFADKNALIFDVGSLKNFAELDFSSIKPNFDPAIFNNLPANFIPAHPIAGSHLTGYENSDADLFVDKNFVVCYPTSLHKREYATTDENALSVSLYLLRPKQIITKIGSKLIELSPEMHDHIYALVSHFPQQLSFLSYPINNINFFQINQLSCPYLQKCFRLNYSDKHLWDEIFILNTKWLDRLLKIWKEYFINTLRHLLNSKNPYRDTRNFITKNENITPSPTTLDDIKQNSREIILRLILVIAYLQIPKIHDYKKYAGKGFADFTSIVSIISIIDENMFNQLFNDNRDNLSLLSKFETSGFSPLNFR